MLIEAELSDVAPLPADPKELARCLADPVWRLSNLYKILVKGDDDDEGTVMMFRPNAAQRRFIARLHHRNVTLKARQLGMTTLVCLMWLDHALFVPNQRCGIVAHNREAAAAIFRDKVRFAYLNLPAQIRAMLPTMEMRADEILLANNSSIRVATSMRSGTIHRLLVSEFGKICKEFPLKAKEVVTGTLPAVPATGIAVIESTAEGQSGAFFKMTQKALELHQLGRRLGLKDYRFHFYAWWQEPKYRIDPRTVLITSEHEYYFDLAEAKAQEFTGRPVHLDAEQRAWYVATLEGDFAGDEQVMWQEYPSYPEEAFMVSTEGTYYAKQMARARKEGRIGTVPYMEGVPVNTFWDIGTNDINAIWFHQRVGAMNCFIDYFEDSGEAPSYYVKTMQDRGYIYGWHYLPHDGAHRRIQAESTKSYEQMLRDLDIQRIEVVPRISSITLGINMMRTEFASCRFDAKKCAKGITHLGNYRKQWNTRLGTWADEPFHDEASNAADAIRQFAQGYKLRNPANRGRTKVNWRTA